MFLVFVFVVCFFLVEHVKKNKTFFVETTLFEFELLWGFVAGLIAVNIIVFCIRQDILGQFSMVNLELFNIVEDVKKVSKAFVVHPKNVNVENATSTCYYMELED